MVLSSCSFVLEYIQGSFHVPGHLKIQLISIGLLFRVHPYQMD